MSDTGLTTPRVLGLIGGVEVNDVYRIKIPFIACGYDWVDLAHSHLVEPNYDVYVISRLAPREDGIAELFAEIGALVYDTDDDMTLLHRNVGDLLYVEFHAQYIKQAELITVTTPHLGKIYLEKFGKPYVVLPNCIEPERWRGLPRIDDRLTIGIAGGDSHYVDWKLVYEPLERIAREYPVRVVVAGAMPDYFDQKWVTYIPWGPYEQLPAMVREFDIGLCPLPVSRFNLCKSAIKAVEYMASARALPHGKGTGKSKDGGVCVLASDMPVYRRVVNNKSNGLLVRDDEWYEAIKRVIEDKFLRWKLQQRGLTWVLKHRDINKVAQKWVWAYRKALRRTK